MLKNLECLILKKLLNKEIKIINLVHSRLKLNGNIFHMDHVVHEKVRFPSPQE